jgi:hypothetical protein
MQQQHRYSAACAAALIGSGRSTDADGASEEERGRRRRQALQWLREDLAYWAKLLDGKTPQAAATVRGKLEHWQRDPDLEGLRDPAGLARLPEAEREAWGQLWADVAILLGRTKGNK